MAGGTTELRRFHVFDCTIGDLSADKNIRQRGDTKKPSQALQCGSTIERWLSQPLANTAFCSNRPQLE